jgi:hypothetical protein
MESRVEYQQFSILKRSPDQLRWQEFRDPSHLDRHPWKLTDMPFNVTTGTAITCTMGNQPSMIKATPGPVVATAPVCTIQDFKPQLNIVGFGMCKSPKNPAVQAATAAKQGAFTPAPCVPATTTPWTPGSLTSFINGLAVLTDASTCQCQWAGVIAVVTAGQTFVGGT